MKNKISLQQQMFREMEQKNIFDMAQNFAYNIWKKCTRWICMVWQESNQSEHLLLGDNRKGK